MKTYVFIALIFPLLGIAVNPGLYTLTAFIFILTATSPYILLLGANDDFVNQSKKLSNFVFIIALVLGFTNLVFITISSGHEPSTLLSFEGVGLIAGESTLIRYQSGQSNSGNPLILALSLWLLFRLSIDGEKASRFKVGLAFLPLIGYTLLTTEKFAMLLGVVFYTVGALSFFDFRTHIKIMLSTSFYGLLLIPILGLSMLIRGHLPSDFPQLLYQLLSYVFFQYYGLGLWLIEQYQTTHLSLGLLTFGGPLSAVGMVERMPGIYDLSYTINGLQSNIYTAYRNISEDFSIFAPFIINLFVAFIYAYFYKTRFKVGLVLLKVYLLFAVLLSFTTTPFVYNSVVFSIFLCLLNVYFHMKNIVWISNGFHQIKVSQIG